MTSQGSTDRLGAGGILIVGLTGRDSATDGGVSMNRGLLEL